MRNGLNMAKSCRERIQIWKISQLLIPIFILLTFMFLSAKKGVGNDLARSEQIRKDIKKHIDDKHNEIHQELPSKEDFNSPATKPSDASLLRYIRQRVILPPSHLPYRIPRVGILADGQHFIVDALFNHMKGGTFVEAGAYNGFSLSNTLFLEQYRQWSGLLVEPDPSSFKVLMEINRKSYKSNSCLSDQQHPIEVKFHQNKLEYLSKVIQEEEIRNADINFKSDEIISIQCFPLESLLLATNISTVHYFSLDVEGLELELLKSLPWNKLDIQVLSVEYKHLPGGKESIIDFMKTQNYSLLKEVTDNSGTPNDIILARNDIIPDLNVNAIPENYNMRPLPHSHMMEDKKADSIREEEIASTN